MNNTATSLLDNEALLDLCVEHGLDEDAFAVYCDNNHVRDNFENEVDGFTDSYRGCYHNFLEFATDLFDDTMDVPAHLTNYIDYEAFARDLLLGGDYWEHNGYVFSNY